MFRQCLDSVARVKTASTEFSGLALKRFKMEATFFFLGGGEKPA